MALKNHNVPALPFLDPGDIRGQRDGRVGKINPQVPHPPEINVGIRLGNLVPLRVRPYVLLHQRHQIVSRLPQPRCHHVGAYAVSVIRVSGLVIPTFVLGTGGNVRQGPLQNIPLVIQTILVPVHAAVHLRNTSAVPVRQALR